MVVVAAAAVVIVKQNNYSQEKKFKNIYLYLALQYVFAKKLKFNVL